MLTADQILQTLPYRLNATEFDRMGERLQGKVRDIYKQGERLLIITTDRISAFDCVLGLIPYKGQILNQLSAWWFEQTSYIIPNHLITVPDPNVTVAHRAAPIPVEIVVRGYITGVTKTALWTLYQQGARQIYGSTLPEGLQKNDPLPQPIITPTTKAADGGHDEPITPQQIVEQKLVTPELWEQITAAALRLFTTGQQIARDAGLILVDTKYEFGLLNDQLILIDEVHTPDSSRYWGAESYQPGQEPDNFDKEYIRKWYAARGYRGDGTPPAMTDELIVQAALRYITVYERLTGQEFSPAEQPANKRIAHNLRPYRLAP